MSLNYQALTGIALSIGQGYRKSTRSQFERFLPSAGTLVHTCVYIHTYVMATIIIYFPTTHQIHHYCLNIIMYSWHTCCLFHTLYNYFLFFVKYFQKRLTYDLNS